MISNLIGTMGGIEHKQSKYEPRARGIMSSSSEQRDIDRREKYRTFNEQLNSAMDSDNFTGTLKKSASKEQGMLEYEDFTYYNSGLPYTRSQAVGPLQNYKSISEGNGNIYSFDLETLGEPLGKSGNVYDQAITTITEFSLIQRTVEGGISTDTVKSFVLGIDEEQYRVGVAILDKYKNGAKLSDTEKSFLDRLTYYSGDFKDVFSRDQVILNNKPFEVFRVNKAGTGNVFDKNSLQSGLDNLRRVGTTSVTNLEDRTKTGNFSNMKSDYGKLLLESAKEELNIINKDPKNNLLMSKNGTNFDIEFLNNSMTLYNTDGKYIPFRPLGNNHLDLEMTLKYALEGGTSELYSAIKNTYGEIEGQYYINGMNRLENIAKALKEDTTSHLAEDDAIFTMDMLSKRISHNETPMTIAEFLETKANKPTSTIKGINKKDGYKNKRFKVTNSLEILENDLDLVSFKSDSGEDLQLYQDWSLKRGEVYKLEKFGTLDVDDNLAKTVIGLDKDFKGNKLYVAKFSNAADNANEVVTIVSKDKQKLQQIFEKNLQVLEYVKAYSELSKQDANGKMVANLIRANEITQGDINSNHKGLMKDKARRKLDYMFDITNPNAWEESKSMFRMASKYKEKGNNYTGHWKQNKIIDDLFSTINDDNKWFFTSGENPKLITQRVESFKEMLNELVGSADVMNKAINDIDIRTGNRASAGFSPNKIKTMALRGFYYETLDNFGDELFDTGKVTSTVPLESMISSTMSSIDVVNPVNAEQVNRIILSNPKQTQDAIFRNALNYAGVKDYKKTINKDKTLSTIKRMEQDLLNRGVMNKPVSMNIKNPHDYAGEVANIIHGNIDDIKMQNIKNAEGLQYLLDTFGKENSDRYNKEINESSLDSFLNKVNNELGDEIREIQSYINIYEVNAREASKVSQEQADAILSDNNYLDLLEQVKAKQEIKDELSSKISGGIHPLVTSIDNAKERTLNIGLDSITDIDTLDNILTESINNAVDYGYMQTFVNKEGSQDSLTSSQRWVEFSKKLTDKYGYSNQNIESLKSALYGGHKNKYGLVNSANAAVTFFENEDGLFMAMSSSKDTESVISSILKKEITDKAVVIQMPKVIHENGGTYVSYNDLRKLPSMKVGTYLDKTAKDLTKGNPLAMRFNIKNTVDDMLSGLTKMHFVIEDELKKDKIDYNSLQRSVQNSFTKPFYNASSPTAARGTNVKDIYDSTNIDFGNLFNYMPLIYDDLNDANKILTPEQEVLKSEMNRVFGATKEEAKNNLMNLRDNILDYDNGRMYSSNDVGVEEKTWFLNRLFEKSDTIDGVQGSKLIDEIVDWNNRNVEKTDFNKSSFGMLEIIQKHGSFLNKDEKVSSSIGFLKNYRDPILGAWGNESSRPLSIQTNAFEPIEINKLDNEYLKEKNIHAPRVVTESMYNDYVQHNKEFREGIVAKYRRLETSDIYNTMYGIVDNADSIAERLNNSDPTLNITSKDISMTAMNYMSVVDTNEQSMIAHPMLRQDLWSTPEELTFRTHKTGEQFIPRLKEGFGTGILSEGEVIGTRIDRAGNKSDVIYNKATSVIKSYNSKNGKMILEPMAPAIPAIKVGLAGVEKGVAFMPSWDKANKRENLLNTIVFEEAFGKDIAVVGNLEVAKHEGFSVPIQNLLYNLENTARDRGEIEELIDNMNSTMGVKAISKDGMIVVKSPEGQGGIVKGITDLENLYKNRDGYSDIFKRHEIDNYGNLIDTSTVLLQKMNMSESHSAAGDFVNNTNSKGMKISERILQVLGIEQDVDDPSLFHKKNLRGESQSYLDPFKDKLRREIRNDETYKMASSDIKNISDSLMMTVTNKSDPSIKIKELTIGDISQITNMTSADMLEDTLFGGFGDDKPSMLKINLPEGLSLNLRDDGKKLTSVYIPHLNNYEVDGMVTLTEPQKYISDFLKELVKTSSLEFEAPLDEQKLKLNTMFQKMIDSNLNEISGGKKSTLVKKLEGRVKHSGQALASAVISPIFVDENGSLMKNYEALKEYVDSGKELRHANALYSDMKNFDDIVYTSKEMFNKMGIDSAVIGKDIARSLVDGDYEDFGISTKLADEMVSNVMSLYGVDIKSANEITRSNAKDSLSKLLNASNSLGDKYLTDIGVTGVQLRYPTFLDTSERVTKIKLRESMKGMTASTHSFTGKNINLDIDADNMSFVANLNNGRLVRNTDSVEEGLLHVLESQKKRNKEVFLDYAKDYFSNEHYMKRQTDIRGVALQAAKQNKAMFDYYGEKVSDILNNPDLDFDDELQDKLIGMYDKFSNMNENTFKRKVAITSKSNKGNIGFISNPNYKVRDLALKAFNDGTRTGSQNMANILNLTNKSEQKIIDTKHIKNFNGKLTQAGAYSEAFKELSKGNTKQGIKLLKGVIEDTDLFGGKNYDNILNSVVDLFSRSDIRELWKYNNGNLIEGKTQSEKIKSLIGISSDPFKYKGKTPLSDQFIDAIANTSQVAFKDIDLKFGDNKIDIGSTISSKSNNSLSLGEADYTIKGKGLDNRIGLHYLDLQSGKNTRRVYGDNLNDLISQNFTSTKDTTNEVIAKTQAILAEARGSLAGHDKVINDMIDFNIGSHSNSIMKKVYDNPEIKSMHYTRDKDYNRKHRAIGDEINNRYSNIVSKEEVASLIDKMNEDTIIRSKIAKSKLANPHLSMESVLAKNNPRLLANIKADNGGLKNFYDSITPPDFKRTSTYYNISGVLNESTFNLNQIQSIFTSEAQNILESNNIDPRTTSMYKDYMNNVIELYKGYNNDTLNLKQTAVDSLIQGGSVTNISQQMNWSIGSDGRLISVKDRKGKPIDAVTRLGKAKIGYGRYLGERIQDLSETTLNKIMNISESQLASSRPDSVEALRLTKAHIGEYLKINQNVSNVDNLKTVKSFTESTAKSEIELLDLNLEKVKELALKKAENVKLASKVIDSSTTTRVINSVNEATKNGKLKTAIIAGAALGLTSFIVGSNQASRLKVMKEEDKKVKGHYDIDETNRIAEQTQMSDSTRMVDGTGVKYNIRGKIKDKGKAQEAIEAVGSTMNAYGRNASSVNSTIEDNSQEIDDNFVKDKFLELLKR